MVKQPWSKIHAGRIITKGYWTAAHCRLQVKYRSVEHALTAYDQQSLLCARTHNEMSWVLAKA